MAQHVGHYQAGGGTLTHYTDSSGSAWAVHTFTTTGSGSFSCRYDLTADILLVGAGGGGGNRIGGGGAGGGVIYREGATVSSGTHVVIVGRAGAGGVTAPGSKGEKTTFLSREAYGGQGGGSGANEHYGDSPPAQTETANGSGANGNGGPSDRAGGTPSAVTSVTSSGDTFYGGYAGDNAVSDHSAGGGAGAGEAGGTDGQGQGGDGIQIGTIYDGINNYYWGGGGAGCQYQDSPNANGVAGGLGGGAGGNHNESSTGGAGGGSAINAGGDGDGTDNTSSNVNGAEGGANSGGGGGGGSHDTGDGGAGGAGIVIIRYKM